MLEFWDLLQSPPGSAAFNMALDEALLLAAAKRARPLLRIYSWEKPSVSFGYFQKFPGYLASQYEIVRRPTGGGLVYHGDSVDTTYTVVSPPEHPLYAMSTSESYYAIHKAVAVSCELYRVESHVTAPRTSFAGAVPTLHKAPVAPPRGQYECFQNSVAGDVVADGQKLAGGAQRRNKHGMLHQGSIAACISTEQLVHGFTTTLGARFESYSLSNEEASEADRLAREKYATHAWNQRIV